MHAAVAKLAIDGLVVIPFTAHYRFHRILSREARAAVFDRCLSYSVIHNYNTISRAQDFFQIFFRGSGISSVTSADGARSEVTIALPMPSGSGVAAVFQLGP